MKKGASTTTDPQGLTLENDEKISERIQARRPYGDESLGILLEMLGQKLWKTNKQIISQKHGSLMVDLPFVQSKNKITSNESMITVTTSLCSLIS